MFLWNLQKSQKAWKCMETEPLDTVLLVAGLRTRRSHPILLTRSLIGIIFYQGKCPWLFLPIYQIYRSRLPFYSQHLNSSYLLNKNWRWNEEAPGNSKENIFWVLCILDPFYNLFWQEQSKSLIPLAGQDSSSNDSFLTFPGVETGFFVSIWTDILLLIPHFDILSSMPTLPWPKTILTGFLKQATKHRETRNSWAEGETIRAGKARTKQNRILSHFFHIRWAIHPWKQNKWYVTSQCTLIASTQSLHWSKGSSPACLGHSPGRKQSRWPSALRLRRGHTVHRCLLELGGAEESWDTRFLEASRETQMSTLAFKKRWLWFSWRSLEASDFHCPQNMDNVSETKAADPFFIVVVKCSSYIPQENKAHADTSSLKEEQS